MTGVLVWRKRARAGGMLVWRGGLAMWRRCCDVRAAGSRGLRKVCERALTKMRGLAGKESGVFGRDAWAGMSRAAEEAGGATGCGGLWACGSTCGHKAPRPNALADKEAARIERGAWAALRCGDASAARGRRRAADTPGEKRASHHSEQLGTAVLPAVRLRLLS